MRTLVKYERLDVPCWALSYLVNGDASGISDEDRAMVDKWYQGFLNTAAEMSTAEAPASVIFSCTGLDGYFCKSPEFGLPCNCDDGQILIVN